MFFFSLLLQIEFGNSLLISGRVHKNTIEMRKCICPFCDFKFQEAKGLKMHLRTHTGEKREYC